MNLLNWSSVVIYLGILFLTACASYFVSTPAVVSSSITPTTPKSTYTSTAIPESTSIVTQTAKTTETAEPTNPPVTELRLRLKNKEGESVPFSKAELLMETWMLTSSLTLTTETNLLVLSLEEEKVRPFWPDIVQDSWHGYLLYIEAGGYVPVLSKPMRFVGTETEKRDSKSQVIVEFPNGSKTEILEGETKEIELTLRKPQNRFLHFVDDDNLYVPGVRVKSYMFWSAANRCRYPVGVNFLAEEISDEDGRISIPDGEFVYLLELEKPLYHLKGVTRYEPPMSLITYLSGQTTVVNLHKLRKQPLEILVHKNGKPLVDKIMLGQRIGTVCGFWPEELGTTDQNGRISLKDFYPEEWEFIFFWQEDGERVAWKADPKEFSEEEMIQVEISD